MKQTFLIKENRPNLVLFFAGWGMDETPFRHLVNRCPEDCDWMICYDYSKWSFDPTLVEEYKGIVIYGWSLGVWEAQKVMETYQLPIIASIAINGTLSPIDEEFGISPQLYEATLIDFTEEKLQKFRKRMCNSSAAYNAFMKMAPQREAKNLEMELFSFIMKSLDSSFEADLEGKNAQWDLAIIGKNDRIFLPKNQLQYWQNNAKTLGVADIAHYDVNLPFLENNQFLTRDGSKHG